MSDLPGAAGAATLLKWVSVLVTLAAEPVAAMEFSVWLDDGVSVIFAQGDIETGDTRKLLRLAAGGLEARRVVMLNSPGGAVAEAVRLGRTIRDLALDTFVGSGGVCASACFFVFIGGTDRLANEAAYIGVHQFSDGEQGTDSSLADSQSLSAVLLDHVMEMGVHPAALARAMETPADGIYYFNWFELKQLRIITPACPWPPGLDGKNPLDGLDPLGLYPECAR